MPVAATPTTELTAMYHEVSERLGGYFLDRGFVVSRTTDGAREGKGDSLLFTGLALYALDCKAGVPLADGLAKMFEVTEGGAYRHPDLASEEVSLDGLLGLYRGIHKRVAHCGEKDLWAPLMRNHRVKMAGNLPAEFNLVAAMLGYKLGLNDVPDLRRVENLALEVNAWAVLVKARKAACYRIHLGLLSLQAMVEMGVPISDKARGTFAEITNGLGMPTIDHFSGRSGLEDWLHGFQYNIYEYRHQRCQAWEQPDGGDLLRPGVDFLVGYADLYGSPT